MTDTTTPAPAVVGKLSTLDRFLPLWIGAAMVAAMDVAGNPSSVHTEGRAAKGLIEKARRQVATALGADGADVVFVSSATEAAALALADRGIACAEIEHEAVSAWCETSLAVAADHPLALAAASRDAEVADFVEACRRGEASDRSAEYN